MRVAPKGRLASKPPGPARARDNLNSRLSKALLRIRNRALNDAQLRDSCRATPEDVLRLRGIAEKPGRNATAQLRALELQLAYGHGRPKGSEGDIGERALDVTLVRVVNQVLSLPPDVVRAYLDTGKLPPGSWLPGYQPEQHAAPAVSPSKPATPKPRNGDGPPEGGEA